MADPVVKVSKSTHDVLTSNVSKRILDSDYPTFKLALSGFGNLVVSSASGMGSVTIAHNLGYTPACMAFTQYIDENTGNVVARYKPMSFWDTKGLRLFDYYQFYADDTNLYLSVILTGWVGAEKILPYMYYIFHNPE